MVIVYSMSVLMWRISCILVVCLWYLCPCQGIFINVKQMNSIWMLFLSQEYFSQRRPQKMWQILPHSALSWNLSSAENLTSLSLQDGTQSGIIIGIVTHPPVPSQKFESIFFSDMSIPTCFLSTWSLIYWDWNILATLLDQTKIKIYL